MNRKTPHPTKKAEEVKDDGGEVIPGSYSALPGRGGGGCGGGIMEEIKQNGALAFGTLRVILRKHNVHQATWAPPPGPWISPQGCSSI
ncbi:hypothetical protein F3Y22_tig00003721pilonHSYRG00055 [Hibiscus syriacus]|uniref:Uncharacterized protein n=1 Tax=Hibiscus syriacus TaxID=106335 RepID=A0A6A3CIX6_HIBSY|nr:hypothetical protein F3Y22_tig00003721pilonHSYRG00055 [Hibiscus syriacus]